MTRGNALVVVALIVAALAGLVVQDGLHGPDVGASRWIAAAAVLGLYAVLCGLTWARARRARRPVAIAGDDALLVVFATQTGFAEELAMRTAKALGAAGHRVVTLPLARVDAAALAATRFAFFVVATYGDGEPPDSAAAFARTTMQGPLALDGLRYGMLALGDRGYARYCGFGADLDRWLEAGGATPAFARVDVDNGAPTALEAWRERLRPWTGGVAAGDLASPAFDDWRFVESRLANPASLGAPAFHVVLAPLHGSCPPWQAGDIAIVRLPDGAQREYSIASLPADGRIELLVRQATRPDGEPGHGARWLTSTLAVGATTALRIRPNHGFRLDHVTASTPLILIGNGTGIAGLRAHLKAREAQGATRNWLLFGERSAGCDRPYAEDLERWAAQGTLEHVSLAFSRDGDAREYVQHRLLAERERVLAWVADTAIVLVCGSAAGMAEDVDSALRAIVGHGDVDAMVAAGRYRRDVY